LAYPTPPLFKWVIDGAGRVGSFCHPYPKQKFTDYVKYIEEELFQNNEQAL